MSSRRSGHRGSTRFCDFLETRGAVGTSNVVSTSARQATPAARVQLHLGVPPLLHLATVGQIDGRFTPRRYHGHGTAVCHQLTVQQELLQDSCAREHPQQRT